MIPVSYRCASVRGRARNPHLFSVSCNNVAQVSNLLYRRASSLQRLQRIRALREVVSLPIGNRRYSRLETCATPLCALSALACSLRVILLWIALAFVLPLLAQPTSSSSYPPVIAPPDSFFQIVRDRDRDA